MKKLILIAGILIAAVSCSTNKQVNFEQLQDRGGLFYLANDQEPFTGDVVSYQAGKPVMEGHMKNGLRDGLWVFYYTSGQKQAEGYYKDGLKEGTWNYWLENGEQDVTEMYKMGNKLGNETAWSSDSVTAPPDPAKPASKTAKPQPAQVQPEPEPQPVQTAKEHEKPKPVVWERLRGGPVKTLDGVPYTGDVVKYFKTGGMELQGHFTNGHRSGKWTYYWPNGNVKDVRYY